MNETTPATRVNNVTQKPYSGLSIASISCGVLSLAMLGILTAIPAVICGHMALGQLKRQAATYNKFSRGMAMAGLITGYVVIALTILLAVFFIIFFLIIAEPQAR